jgi:GxxExxY protein
MLTKKYLDDLTYEIIGSAIEVHKTLGQGLLESVYHQCLKEEPLHGKIDFLAEMKIPTSKNYIPMWFNKINNLTT